MDTPSRKSIEEQQLQHSGDLGLEQPQVHYDNTPLPQAFGKHLTDTAGNVIVPDNIASVHEAEAPKKSRKKLFVGLGAGATAVAAGAALAFGLMLPKGDGSNTPPETDPSATSQPTQDPETSPTPAPETEPGTAPTTFEIPVSTTPEKLGETYTDILSAWSMSGSETPSLQDDMVLAIAKGEATSYYDYYLPFAEESSKTIADDVFIEGWENNSELTKWVDINTNNNAANIETWSQTYNSGNSEDIEPFKYWVTTDSTEVVANNSDGISIKSNITEHANIDKNRSATLEPELSRINGNTMTLYATFVADGDSYKIKSINIIPRQ